jgi:hypothetical protein
MTSFRGANESNLFGRVAECLIAVAFEMLSYGSFHCTVELCGFCQRNQMQGAEHSLKDAPQNPLFGAPVGIAFALPMGIRKDPWVAADCRVLVWVKSRWKESVAVT